MVQNTMFDSFGEELTSEAQQSAASTAWGDLDEEERFVLFFFTMILIQMNEYNLCSMYLGKK
jgi:hypothetical protein